MDGNKISVVVPMYNSEKFITKCLDSVVSQTYKNWECIVVDDGSTDNSYNVVAEKYKSEPRIKLYKQKNGGVSSARNIGIKKLTGNFISFVDSDDYLENNYLENMLNAALTYNADMVICEIKSSICKMHINAGLYGIKDFLSMVIKITENPVIAFVTNKMYKADIIKNKLLFNESLDYGEDNDFIISYLRYCKSVYLLDEFLYNYCDVNENALTKLQKKDYKVYWNSRKAIFKNYSITYKSLGLYNRHAADIDKYLLVHFRRLIFLVDRKIRKHVFKKLCEDDDLKEVLNKYLYKDKEVTVSYFIVKYKFYILLCILMKSARFITKYRKKIHRKTKFDGG